MNIESTIESKVDELVMLDNNFCSKSENFLIKHELEIFEEYMNDRVLIVNELEKLLSQNINLTSSFTKEIENIINTTTKKTTEKCKSIQKELKSRIISSTKVKSAYQYTDKPDYVNPTFVDKTV